MKKLGSIFGKGILGCMIIPIITALVSGGGTLQKTNQGEEMELLLAQEAVLEIPFGYPFEAVKAQTVLIRSRYQKRLEQGDTKEELYQEIWQKQKRLGWEETEFCESMKICEKAARETENVVLSYCGEVVEGAYFLAGNGSTRDGIEVFSDCSYGWLTQVENSCDLDGPDYLSAVTKSSQEVEEKLYRETGEITEGALEEQIEICSRDSAGYVMIIRVGNTMLSGERFRKVMGLSSSCFYIQFENENVRFVCQGVGHGMGLCQYGASVLAKEGADYQEILRFYFPEAELTCIDF
ncbi:MAG: SpoIID/LytB domain-containing protein [Fusicatenibacter sp.]|nr:SpoIID/LytB domain-containing protein [Fusicatenibacter sp.]